MVEFEIKIVRPDGTDIWYLMRNLPAYDDAHNIIGVSIVLTNIHERKAQEILLEESRANYRAILNSTSDVYFLVSPDLKLLATNSTGEESLIRLIKTWNLSDKQIAFEQVFKRSGISG